MLKKLEKNKYLLKTKSFWAFVASWFSVLLAMIGTTYMYVNREDFRVANPQGMQIHGYWKIDPFSLGGNTGMFFFGYLICLGLVIVIGFCLTALILMIRSIDIHSKE